MPDLEAGFAHGGRDRGDRVDAQDRIDTGNWPVAGMTMVSFRNNHLSYALTWFGMALLALLAAGFVARSEFRRKR